MSHVEHRGFVMATHNMNLKQPYFDLIKNGAKTIELRLWDEKRRKVQPGDTIVFDHGNECFPVTIKGLILAQNFDSLFDIIDISKTGLGDKENALKVMELFYDKSAQDKFGVVGIIIS